MSNLTECLNDHVMDMSYTTYSELFDCAEAEDRLVGGLSKLVRDMIIDCCFEGYDVTKYAERAYDLGVDLTKDEGR